MMKDDIAFPVFVVEMPIDEDGNGPVDLEDAAEVIYLVWDQTYQEISQSSYREGAQDVADVYNEMYYDGAFDEGE